MNVTDGSPLAPRNLAQKQGSTTISENPKPVKSAHIVRQESTTNTKPDSVASPTKGILLTPGTATTRRKNVSFGGLAPKEVRKAEISSESIPNVSTSSGAQPTSLFMDFPPVNQQHQTNLTKALYKARINESKANLDKVSGNDKLGIEVNLVREPEDEMKTVPANQKMALDSVVDTTIDLDEPFSRSGKHWKAEFEQYHKKSDREMKKIIKYGQGVKSYAAQKDLEVSDLGEKLQKELSKVATLEANITSLAAQLASTRGENPKESSDQAQLVKDLTKQTALAVQYRQKADRYKLALVKGNGETQDLENIKDYDTPALNPTRIHDNATTASQESYRLTHELDSLRAQLETFRNSTQRAERKAARLEAENQALKKTIFKLKEDIKTNEAKRLCTEGSIKKRENGLQVPKADCDPQVMKLPSRSPKIASRIEQQGKSPEKVRDVLLHQRRNQTWLDKDQSPTHDAHNHFSGINDAQSLKSPSKNRQPPAHVDIWTSGNMESTLPLEKSIDKGSADQIAESSSSILQEINQNIVSEKNTPKQSSPIQAQIIPLKPMNLLNSDLSIPSPLHPSIHPIPQKPTSTPITRLRHRRSIIPSPRPSMLNLTSSPAKLFPGKTSQASRVGKLSEDRVAAAKARLQKRREEKKLRSGMVKGE